MKSGRWLLVLLFLFLLNENQLFAQRKSGIIDDHDKANLTMASKKNPFYTIIYEAVTTGRKGSLIKAYRDTAFKKVISPEEIIKIGSGEETFQIYPDPTNPDVFYDTTVFVPFNPEKISRYLVIYDINTKPEEPPIKIVAIAPLIDNWVANVKLNEQIIFWVKFEDLAEVAGKEIFNSPENPGGQLTFKDFFEKNLFFMRDYDPTIIIYR
ncbi:MAG TPA: hypothetical protein P5050_02445 [Bacteroidia bacterium]|nr:hypothetical protein [Sphingobacteriales bacterium]HPD66093.1 hypothetical protein [Bacteroidia bacterium]HRS58060.1 hypothetical protein [Bacteroidia bacterium]HRU66922.1 hypothetical protein [Bacteroidia bacterium]